MKQSSKNLFEKRIKIILSMFQDFINLNKIKNDTKSKSLVSKIIIEETKARICDNKNIYEEKIEKLNNESQKKIVSLKRNQIKFSKMQTKIQKFLNKFPLYKNLYSNFSITSFAIENIELVKKKQNLYSENLKRKKIIKLLNSAINNEKNDNSIIFGNYLVTKEEELKNIEKKIENVKEIIDKVKYIGNNGSVINLRECENEVDGTVIECDNSRIVNNEDSNNHNEADDLSVIIKSNIDEAKNIFSRKTCEENDSSDFY